VRLWQGAQLWINPEIDQGFGLANTHGVAGFTSAEAYKEGAAYPYARVHRAFIRQTIDLGGNSEKVDADINQFAGAQTATVAVQPIVDRLSRIVSECLHLDAVGRKTLLQHRQSRGGFGEGPTLATDKGDPCCIAHCDFLVTSSPSSGVSRLRI
jgi:hypothetical protein